MRECRKWVGVLLAAALVAPVAAREKALVFAHVNDVHGYAFPRAYWGEQLPEREIGKTMGGLFSAARAVRLLREGKMAAPGEKKPPGRKRDVLFMDAGDWFGGTLHGERTGGRALARVFADPDLALDASVPGNHAWDFGPEPFLDFLEIIHPAVDVVCANIKFKRRKLPHSEPIQFYDVEGVKVGVLGLVTDGALRATLPERAKGFTITKEEAAIRRWVPVLRKNADYVVLLSHIGFGRDRKKLAMLDRLDDEDPDLNIDLVIDGHSHRDEEVWADEDTFVVQADHYGLRLGVVRVPVEKGGGFGKPVAERIVLDAATLRPERRMLRRHRDAIAERDRVEEELVVPTEDGLRIPHLLRTDTKNLVSKMGDFVCEAFLRAARRAGHEPDLSVAYHNGVRSGLYARPGGGITAGRIHAVSPFGGPIVVVETSGKELRRVVKVGVRTRNRMSYGGAFAVGRELRRAPREKRELESFEVGGEPLDDDRRYRVVVDEFLAGWFKGDDVVRTELAENPRDAVTALLKDLAGSRPLKQRAVDRVARPSAKLLTGGGGE